MAEASLTLLDRSAGAHMTSLPIRSSRVCSRSEFLLLHGDERSAELNWRGQLVDLGRGWGGGTEGGMEGGI